MKKFDDTLPAELPRLDKAVKRLCHPDSLSAVWHNSAEGAAMPSIEDIREIMSSLAAAIFPGYFGQTQVRLDSLRYHLAANLDSIYHKMSEQILRGFCFTCEKQHAVCPPRDSQSKNAALAFIDALPEIRRLLAGDAKAAYEGDPAAQSPGEAIFCYPSLRAMLHHRIAHELYKLGVPVIPRMISEMAHAHTGIDIHPGADIGEEFFMDHGTGVVIGETSIIGRNCRLYQGVTLGALSFLKSSDGSLIKGIPRHPILEDNVTVYAGATLLGRITIGRGAVVGGNMWITSDVPLNARISQEQPRA
ncbi:MAG: serine acetyltransferase [Desulfovibrio sp.]|jgi:serine O-acetyltransferase|nr:serine acetyltransferase [Desulfovibrio sp.]